MGDAKRRKALDPLYGQPIACYGLIIHPFQSKEEIFEIPFTVDRRNKWISTLQAAQATAIAIMGQLTSDEPAAWAVDVEEAIGREGREMIDELRAEVPGFVWGRLLCPGGEEFIFSNHKGALPEDVVPPCDWYELNPGESIHHAIDSSQFEYWDRQFKEKYGLKL